MKEKEQFATSIVLMESAEWKMKDQIIGRLWYQQALARKKINFQISITHIFFLAVVSDEVWDFLHVNFY